ncbi:hypothetical protein PHMEG_0007858 [Phytophthora megakarya]|uniref:ZSWIM1/3 RNaseH-like domain-containing protein n=1 Tax=Phytophthora megakarya TaxID=4795 RepID=A0A225WK71_9STRA|nr:hypothetical protein PHMEG_0007858 [Phytophthora megakarya]
MVHKLVKSKAPFKQIHTYAVESSGKDVTRQDVRNLVANVLKDEKVGSVATRVERLLNEFVSNNPRNASRIFGDDGGTARCLTIQTAGMRKMFDLFPEIVMVDTAHKANDLKYKLFIWTHGTRCVRCRTVCATCIC